MAGETKILAFAEGVSVSAPTQTPLTTYTVATKTAAYTATTADEVLICDTTSAAFTLTLPTAVGNTGKSFWIHKIGTAANDLTIDPNGSQTIDGQTTMLLSGQYRSVQIVSDGSNWVTISKDEETIVSKTTTYTATQEDDIILCSASGGAWTLTLPAAAASKGKVYRIIKTDSSANAVTVDGNGAETIDGATTTALNAQYNSLTITCDGSAWYSIGRERLPTIQKFTSGSGTYTTPAAVKHIKVLAIGGGGGGGGSGAGAGNGGNGGDSTFGSSLISAGGGSGGVAAGAGGAGGTSSLGSAVGHAVSGAKGQGGGGGSGLSIGGQGGDGILGGGGGGGPSGNNAGYDGATNSGGGGGGAGSAGGGNCGAGGGAGGGVIGIITSPSATYAYAVGAAGAAGAGANAGGAGGSGFIMVEEYYQ